MVTINGALASTSAGQVVADTIGGRQFSGIGGHEDFVAVVGPRARGPVADLPAVDRRSSTGPGVPHRRPARRRGRSSPRLATSSTWSSPSTAWPSCAAAPCASGRGARRDRPPRLPRRAPGPRRDLATDLTSPPGSSRPRRVLVPTQNGEVGVIGAVWSRGWVVYSGALAWRRGRVVQARACKALYAGSIPAAASNADQHFRAGQRGFANRTLPERVAGQRHT